MASHLSGASRIESQLETLSRLEFNYDETKYRTAKDKAGWNVDHYEAILGYEAPGEPVAGGPFERVKDTIRLYKFPDPRLIRAVFDPESPLSGRNMLMLAKFMGITFTFGVRVTGVIDELRTSPGGARVRAWGYSYRTLQGHFEIGEIRFESSKNLDTGAIGFEIDAYSKPDRIPNFFYRIGFKIFGRTLQKYFAHSSIRRLEEVTRTAARGSGGSQPAK